MRKLQFGFHKVYGRSKGKITSYQRGGGLKVNYKAIDFFRFLPNVMGKIVSIVPDPNRTSKVCLIAYTNGILSYGLLVNNLKVGHYIRNVWSGESFNLSNFGISCPLFYVKPGSFIHNVELVEFGGGKISRSAGTKCILLKKFKKTGLVKLPSGKLIVLPLQNVCTIGDIGFSEHKLKVIGKAGINRNRNKRPHVRGQAMNPVDHPHGGRTNGGKIPCTPWGRIAKGVKTRKVKKKNNFMNLHYVN